MIFPFRKTLRLTRCLHNLEFDLVRRFESYWLGLACPNASAMPIRAQVRNQVISPRPAPHPVTKRTKSFNPGLRIRSGIALINVLDTDPLRPATPVTHLVPDNATHLFLTGQRESRNGAFLRRGFKTLCCCPRGSFPLISM